MEANVLGPGVFRRPLTYGQPGCIRLAIPGPEESGRARNTRQPQNSGSNYRRGALFAAASISFGFFSVPAFRTPAAAACFRSGEAGIGAVLPCASRPCSRGFLLPALAADLSERRASGCWPFPVPGVLLGMVNSLESIPQSDRLQNYSQHACEVFSSGTINGQAAGRPDLLRNDGGPPGPALLEATHKDRMLSTQFASPGNHSLVSTVEAPAVPKQDFVGRNRVPAHEILLSDRCVSS
jgi:hypothetical protein